MMEIRKYFKIKYKNISKNGNLLNSYTKKVKGAFIS
jgi:hypothetical protein